MRSGALLVSSLAVLGALLAPVGLTGCVAEGENIGSLGAEIINGTRETGERSVVAVIRRDWTTGAGGLCTGSVIGPYAVMTAKHCVFEESRPLASSQFLVLVGSDIQSMGGVESFHPVIEIRTTAGTDINADIENGNDIAILLLDAPIGVPAIPLETGAPVTGAAVTVVGFGRTMTGVPSPTDSGVKYRGTTRVDRVGSRIFETVGASWTCQGDSGGPVWNTASGSIIGITSFGIGERCTYTNSFFSRVDIHRSLIADALSYAPVCAPETEVCDGVDNDCNGGVDEGCTPLGEPCTADEECARGGCEDVGGTRVCIRDCDATDAIPMCPLRFYCEETVCGAGRCIFGDPGGGADGAECAADTDCASLRCADVGGVMRCGRSCSIDTDPCPPEEVCEGAAAGVCGSCVPVEFSTGPRPFGAPCDTDAQCADGACPEGFCTRGCPPECPSAFHCRASLCRRGDLGGPGSECVDSEDCGDLAPDCVDADTDFICAGPCDAGGACGPGLECASTPVGERCLPPGLPLGETCAEGADCRSGICGGNVCTRICDPTDPCPSGFDCNPAGEVSGCFRALEDPARRDRGGCASAGDLREATPWLALALGGLLLRRRRR